MSLCRWAFCRSNIGVITCDTTRPCGELWLIEGCLYMNLPLPLYQPQLTIWASSATGCGTKVHLDWVYFCWNWKHYSKIIFKCVNSTVRFIFNEKVIEKWNLWVCKQYINILFMVKKSINTGWIKKIIKKEKSAEQKPDATIIWIQSGTRITHFVEANVFCAAVHTCFFWTEIVTKQPSTSFCILHQNPHPV